MCCPSKATARPIPEMAKTRRSTPPPRAPALPCADDEIIHRRLHAALLVRDAGERQRHLGAGERADEHGVVGVAEMADAEILPA